METSVLPGHKIEVTYLQPIPGISDLAYGTGTTILTWASRVDDYVAERAIRHSWKNKYVLVTPDPPAPGKLGMALPAKGVAMATLSGPYTVIAHELGHTFGAEHSLSETRMGRWWVCRTTMASPHTPLLAHCYVYSASNLASIRRHVDLKGYLPVPWRYPAAR